MKIKMERFLPYENTGVLTIKPGLSLIRGQWVGDKNRSNGSGKSAIMEGVSWCWWGEARTTKEKPAGDDLIHRPAYNKTMKVDVDYNGLRVNRSRTHNKSTKLQAEYDLKKISGGIKDVQGKIN
jgi:DNA repair exonuclease SbcCD ATPase subunit